MIPTLSMCFHSCSAFPATLPAHVSTPHPLESLSIHPNLAFSPSQCPQTQQSIKAAEGSYTWHYSLSQPPSTSASSTSSSSSDSASSYSIPPNVAVISMQELSPSTVVLRLAHLYEPGEHAALSSPAQVDLRQLFAAKQ
ncbi:unnamed protein product, partial [Closterium sp. NIES-54]